MLTPFTARRSMRRGTQVLLLGLAAATALGQAGCTAVSDWVHNGFKVGPNYGRPPVPIPAQWIDTNDPRVHQGAPNLAQWWDVFDDPILTRLLHDSYAYNLTIRAAGAQIMQAQIARFIAKSELLPQGQTAIAGFVRSMASGTGGSALGAGADFWHRPVARTGPVSREQHFDPHQRGDRDAQGRARPRRRPMSPSLAAPDPSVAARARADSSATSR